MSVADTTRPTGDYSSLLKSQGIYPTSQRLEIAGALFARHQHVTADDLYSILSKSGSDISKATVYNTLNLFADKGLLLQVNLDANKTYFDSNNRFHHHFYNLDTGELTDITDDLAAPIKAKPPKGTQIESVNVVIRIRNEND